MNSITVSAKTVSDAITEASIQLGVVSTSMEYRVIEEGSAGFLGIGRKQAVIEAWKKEEKIEKPGAASWLPRWQMPSMIPSPSTPSARAMCFGPATPL